jgi:hypothetical protein
MNQINTGGLAFPIKGPIMTSDELGMTLRDYFAAKAMQGLLANPKLYEHLLKEGNSWVENSAYAWADAMLKAREE